MVERLVLAEGVRLESGAALAPLEIAYARYGDPAHPVVYVCHALTGDAEAAVWWDTLVGPGRPIDTERFHVICANLLGGCRGTTGPSSTAPSGRPYGLDFPLFTVRDLVAVHRLLLRALGVGVVHAAIGGSLGGMQILQWALDFPDELARAVLVCASARLSAQNVAFSKVARHAILAHGAMDVARMMAHITYLSERGMELKFARARRGAGMTLRSDFEVEHYLDHQAEVFLARFDPLTYLYLSRVMDYFDPFAEPPGRAPATRFLVLSFDSDWRFGTEHSVAIERALAERGVAVRRREIASPWGHDSFLMDVPDYHAAVRAFVTE